MRKRFVLWVALAGLVVVPPRAWAAEDKPTVVVRVTSLDNLIATAHKLTELAGKEEEAKQVEELLKSKTGPKGLEGLDTTRPIGLYGKLEADVVSSKVVLMVPVADEQVVLDMLERLDIKAQKDKGGLYTVSLERSPFPVYFRFANKYVYATARDEKVIAKDQLLSPETVFPADRGGTASVSLNIDQIPDEIKQMALGQAGLRVADLKDKKLPREDEEHKKLRGTLLDQGMSQFKNLLADGGEVRLALDVSPKSGDLSVALSLAGKEGSDLAKSIAALGQARSLGATLFGTDAALNLEVHLGPDERVRRLVEPVIDDGIKKILQEEKDANKRAMTAILFKAVAPTLKMAEADLGVSFRGPNEAGHFTIVAGLKVKQGDEIAKALKELAKDLPRTARDKVKLDAETADGFTIHRLEMEEKDLDADARKLFGKPALYVAIRDDALVLAGGEDSLSALKEVLGRKAGAGQPARLEISLARMAPLMVKDNKAAPEVAKKVFGSGRDNDKIDISVSGGKQLTLRMDLKGPLVKFFIQLDEAKKKGQ